MKYIVILLKLISIPCVFALFYFLMKWIGMNVLQLNEETSIFVWNLFVSTGIAISFTVYWGAAMFDDNK